MMSDKDFRASFAVDGGTTKRIGQGNCRKKDSPTPSFYIQEIPNGRLYFQRHRIRYIGQSASGFCRLQRN